MLMIVDEGERIQTELAATKLVLMMWCCYRVRSDQTLRHRELKHTVVNREAKADWLIIHLLTPQMFAEPAIAEKGYLDVEVSVATAGGHSSVPRKASR